jgi:hypothetical protein
MKLLLILILLNVLPVKACSHQTGNKDLTQVKKLVKSHGCMNLYDLMTQQERDKFMRYVIMLDALENRRLSKRHSI